MHKFLKSWRKSRKFTQGVLAEKLGVAISTVSGWESGDRQVDLADLDKLAKVYDVHPAALLLSPEDANPKIARMREASDLVVSMDEGAQQEWLALGRRLAGRPPSE